MILWTRLVDVRRQPVDEGTVTKELRAFKTRPPPPARQACLRVRVKGASFRLVKRLQRTKPGQSKASDDRRSFCDLLGS